MQAAKPGHVVHLGQIYRGCYASVWGGRFARPACRLHVKAESELRARKDRPRKSDSSPAAKRPPKATELSCKHFGVCSGCVIENSIGRPPLLGRAQKFFQGLDLQGPFTLDVGPVHSWRCRAKLAAQSGPHGRPIIGLFRQDSHDVVAIPSCRIHHPRINQAVELVTQMAAQLRTPVHDHTGPSRSPAPSGALRYLQLTAVARGAPGGHVRAELDPQAQIQVVLVWGGRDETDPGFHQCQALCKALWTYGGAAAAAATATGSRASGPSSAPAALLHSVWVNFNGSSSRSGDGTGESVNTILGPTWKHMAGAADVWQQFGRARVCLGPGSFVQANYGAMQAALGHILQAIPTGSRLVELHAGVGVIGLAAAAAGRITSLRCVDVNPACAEPFAMSRQQLEPSFPVEFVVAAAGSSPATFIRDADVLVMDPPRKGLEPEVLTELCRRDVGPSAPHTLVYLSCGYDALERDLTALLSSGRWRLEAARALLFFPGTNSLETLVVLCGTEATRQ